MKLKWIDLLALVLVIVGALNWGLIGAANFNLVTAIVGTIPLLEKLVYDAVGLAGLWMIYVSWIKAK